MPFIKVLLRRANAYYWGLIENTTVSHAMEKCIIIRKEWRIVLDTDMEYPPVCIVNRKKNTQRNMYIVWYYLSKRKGEKHTHIYN